MLSASAVQAYSYTDPSLLPRLQVLSSQRVDVDRATATFTVVDVATTAGTIRVDLTRTAPASGWVMDRMDLTEVLPGPQDGLDPNPSGTVEPDDLGDEDLDEDLENADGGAVMTQQVPGRVAR